MSFPECMKVVRKNLKCILTVVIALFSYVCVFMKKVKMGDTICRNKILLQRKMSWQGKKYIFFLLDLVLVLLHLIQE